VGTIDSVGGGVGVGVVEERGIDSSKAVSCGISLVDVIVGEAGSVALALGGGVVGVVSDEEDLVEYNLFMRRDFDEAEYDEGSRSVLLVVERIDETREYDLVERSKSDEKAMIGSIV
jgi:hypothetical protein